MRDAVSQNAKYDKLDGAHIPYAGTTVVVYEVIRQDT